MKLTRIAEILKMEGDGREITVKGWVRTKRGNKNVAFIAMNDGSCVANIQVVVDLSKIDEAYELFENKRDGVIKVAIEY